MIADTSTFIIKNKFMNSFKDKLHFNASISYYFTNVALKKRLCASFKMVPQIKNHSKQIIDELYKIYDLRNVG